MSISSRPIRCEACGLPSETWHMCDRWDCPDLDSVNSDPDAELADPEDDTIGGDWDDMADWPLEDEGGDEDDDE